MIYSLNLVLQKHYLDPNHLETNVTMSRYQIRYLNFASLRKKYAVNKRKAQVLLNTLANV